MIKQTKKEPPTQKKMEKKYLALKERNRNTTVLYLQG